MVRPSIVPVPTQYMPTSHAYVRKADASAPLPARSCAVRCDAGHACCTRKCCPNSIQRHSVAASLFRCPQGRRRHVRRSRIRLQAHAVAGMVAVGPSLDKAMYVANEVETLCEQYSRALSVRTLLSAGASAPTVPCTHARTRIWQHSLSTSSTKPSSTVAMSARSLTGRGFSARTIRR